MNILNMYCSDKLFRPDITVMVDWALKINYLSIYPINASFTVFDCRVCFETEEED